MFYLLLYYTDVTSMSIVYYEIDDKQQLAD